MSRPPAADGPPAADSTKAAAVGRAGGDGAAGAWRLLVTVHIAVIALPVFYALKYSPAVSTYGDMAVVIGLSALAGGLQFRHSLAAARGQTPRWWPWTLTALVVLAYLPLSWYGLSWGVVQIMVIASGLMLLGPVRGAGLTVVVLGIATAASVHVYGPRDTPAKLVYDVLSGVVFDLVVGVALYGVVRLVRVLDELASARGDLADLAVSRERLRVSRDLHDLLGQSLSAVSLKGDLAIRLLDRDPSAARTEIQGLTVVARQALHGVRAITRDEHVTTLRAETDGAVALLDAADIAVTVRVDRPALDQRPEAVLAWAVREGVTNVLRHSEATRCDIQAVVGDGSVTLSVSNDGAGPAAPYGNGLTGLAERARAVGGSLTVDRPGPGQFRLRVTVPIVAGEAL